MALRFVRLELVSLHIMLLCADERWNVCLGDVILIGYNGSWINPLKFLG